MNRKHLWKWKTGDARCWPGWPGSSALVVVLTALILLGGWFGMDLIIGKTGLEDGDIHAYEKTAAAGDILAAEGSTLNLFPFNQFKEENTSLYSEKSHILSSASVTFFLEQLVTRMESDFGYLDSADWETYLKWDEEYACLYVQDMPITLYRNSTGNPVKCKLSLAATEDLSMVIFYHLAAETDKTLSVQEVLEGTEDMENTRESSRQILEACAQALNSTQFYEDGKQTSEEESAYVDREEKDETFIDIYRISELRGFMFYQGISETVPFQKFLYALGTCEVDEEGQNVLGQRFPLAYSQMSELCELYFTDYTTITSQNEILFVMSGGKMLLYYNPQTGRFTGFGIRYW
ncbi:MAG: hypothetical protein ACLUUJ_09960 [Acutalibacteraceae bacterium]